jgi:hypothetical protein
MALTHNVVRFLSFNSSQSLVYQPLRNFLAVVSNPIFLRSGAHLHP